VKETLVAAHHEAYPVLWSPVQRQCQCSEWQFSWWTVRSWWRSACENAHCRDRRPHICRMCGSPRPFAGTTAGLLRDLHQCIYSITSKSAKDALCKFLVVTITPSQFHFQDIAWYCTTDNTKLYVYLYRVRAIQKPRLYSTWQFEIYTVCHCLVLHQAF